jgi:hypothetical protein
MELRSCACKKLNASNRNKEDSILFGTIFLSLSIPLKPEIRVD